MTKEELEKEAIKRVDAFIDSFSQDIRSTLYDKLNQEDVKDFLYSLYIDSAEPREKKIARLQRSLLDVSEKATKRIAELEQENKRLLKENSKLGVRIERVITENLELKRENADQKANFDYFIEGQNLKIKELEEENNKLLDVINNQDVKIADLEKQNKELQEKLNNAETSNAWYRKSSYGSLYDEIDKLKAQIEKMKCCPNCKFEDNDYMEKPCYECIRCLGDIKRKGNTDKWELKEITE